MINIEEVLVVCSNFLLPFLIYLVIISYSNTFSFEKNQIYLTLFLFSSLFLMLKYGQVNKYTIIFYSLPVLISYICDKPKSAVILSIIIIIDNYKYLNIYLLISLILEYLIYLVVYKKFKGKKKFKEEIISIFVTIKTFIITGISFYKKINLITFITNLINIFVSIGILIILINVVNNLLEKTKEIKKLVITKNELEKEKRMRTSIFKLTHELKNPLAVCNGYLDMMDFDNTNKTKKYFNIVKDEIKRSLTIINDFSALGKIKELEKEELDLSYLFEDIKEKLDTIYKENRGEIILNFNKEIYIEADYNRLKQVFINILKNSLEAKNKEKIIVKVDIKDMKMGIKVIISDNGCGISKKELKHIGETFYTTKSNGTGLGLSYCREIIELHGGDITFKSEYDKGMTVFIYLPKKKVLEDF